MEPWVYLVRTILWSTPWEFWQSTLDDGREIGLEYFIWSYFFNPKKAPRQNTNSCGSEFLYFCWRTEAEGWWWIWFTDNFTGRHDVIIHINVLWDLTDSKKKSYFGGKHFGLNSSIRVDYFWHTFIFSLSSHIKRWKMNLFVIRYWHNLLLFTPEGTCCYSMFKKKKKLIPYLD